MLDCSRGRERESSSERRRGGVWIAARRTTSQQAATDQSASIPLSTNGMQQLQQPVSVCVFVQPCLLKGEGAFAVGLQEPP